MIRVPKKLDFFVALPSFVPVTLWATFLKPERIPSKTPPFLLPAGVRWRRRFLRFPLVFATTE